MVVGFVGCSGTRATHGNHPLIWGDLKVWNNITWRVAPPTEVGWDTISRPLDDDLKLNITHVIVVLILYLGMVLP